MRIVLTRKAEDDLDGIVFYTLGNFGPAQADRYIGGLNAFLNDLPTHQYRLRPVQSRLRSAYWRAVFQAHVVFARKSEDRLLIVRILHDKMNPENYLP